MVLHGFNFNQKQRQRLYSAMGPLSMRLTKNQLEGNDILEITPTLKKKISKAIQNGKGVQINLSQTTITKNRRAGHLASKGQGLTIQFKNQQKRNSYKKGSGLLSTVGNQFAKPAMALGQEIFDDAVFDIFGSGLPSGNKEEVVDELAKKSNDQEKRKALEILSKPSNLKKVKSAKTPEQLAKNLSVIKNKELSGSGLSGGGWKDALLWAGAILGGPATLSLMINYKVGEKVYQKATGKMSKRELQKHTDNVLRQTGFKGSGIQFF